MLFCKVDRKSIVLSAELKTCDKSVPITALVDSGAMENFINSDLVRKHNLPTEPLPNPIIAWNADNSINSEITKTVTGTLTLGQPPQPILFLSANIGKHDAILGYSWLRDTQPSINWKNGTVSFPADYRPSLSALDLTPEDLDLIQLIKPPSDLDLEKLTTDSLTFHVPLEYHDFLKVFSEEASSWLPEHKSWDHTIELKPDFIPYFSKLYPLNLEEDNITKEMIDEYLARGTICPSKSPQASGWFFVDKKNRKKWLCQNYQYLND